MTHHFLLAMLTGLLAYKYDKDNEKLMRYLWVIACIMWIINVISDVINLIGQKTLDLLAKLITIY